MGYKIYYVFTFQCKHLNKAFAHFVQHVRTHTGEKYDKYTMQMNFVYFVDINL